MPVPFSIWLAYVKASLLVETMSRCITRVWVVSRSGFTGCPNGPNKAFVILKWGGKKGPFKSQLCTDSLKISYSFHINFYQSILTDIDNSWRAKINFDNKILTQFCCCLVWCFHSHVIVKVVLYKAKNKIRNEIIYSFPFFLKLLRYFLRSN